MYLSYYLLSAWVYRDYNIEKYANICTSAYIDVIICTHIRSTFLYGTSRCPHTDKMWPNFPAQEKVGQVWFRVLESCKFCVVRRTWRDQQRRNSIPFIVEAVPWHRRLVSALSHRRLGFESRAVHIGFVVDEMAMAQVFSEYFCTSCHCHSTNTPFSH